MQSSSNSSVVVRSAVMGMSSASKELPRASQRVVGAACARAMASDREDNVEVAWAVSCWMKLCWEGRETETNASEAVQRATRKAVAASYTA